MSIVTGETFYRASKLIGMLLENCTEAPRSFQFKGIFTLVNRSSYSTIRTMVENPENDYHAFLHLSVPHYNTYKGICPGCLHEQQSRRIIDRCTTSDALNGFSRWLEKQKLRTPEEHRRWLAEEIWWSPEDFSKLCLWFYCKKVERNAGEAHTSNWCNDFTILQKKCLDIIEESERKKRPIRLRDYKEHLDGLDKTLENLWIDEIVQDRSYMRLRCTHKAYCVLEDDELLKNKPVELSREATSRILNRLFLDKEMKEKDPTAYIEWIISYIKVLSRDYLSKHHYIRQAIFDIMTWFLGAMFGQPMRVLFSDLDAKATDISGPSCTDLTSEERKSDVEAKTEYEAYVSEVINKCKQATPLQHYQLIMVLLRQLAAMQANVVIQDDTLAKLVTIYQNLVNEQEKLENENIIFKLCRLPTAKKVERDYIRCVKLCLLSGDEENKSLLLQKQKNMVMTQQEVST